mgnify:FL=1
MLKIKFSQDKESQIFERLTSISADVRDSVELIRSLYRIYCENKDDINQVFVRIKSISDRVAMSREEIMSVLYREPFLPDFKEAMLKITQALYDVTKAIKDSARALTTRNVSCELLQKVHENILKYFGVIVEASTKLTLMISLLRDNVQESLKISKEVQNFERLGDEVKDVLLEQIYRMDNVSDFVSIIQMRDFVLSLDDALDSMEEAAIGVELFYVTLKS